MSKFTGTLTSPHPTQTPKFAKHTWREQVHRDVNIPPTPNPKKKERGFRDQCLGVALGSRLTGGIALWLWLRCILCNFTLYSNAAEVRPPSTELAFIKMVPGNLHFSVSQNDYQEQMSSISKHLVVDYYRGLYYQIYWRLSQSIMGNPIN